MNKFFITLSAYSLCLYGACRWAEEKHRWEMPDDAPGVIISLAILTAALYSILVYFYRKLANRFPLAYLASITVKLIFSLGFLLYLIRRHPTWGEDLAIVFLASYLGFTVIEVFYLRKLLSK